MKRFFCLKQTRWRVKKITVEAIGIVILVLLFSCKSAEPVPLPKPAPMASPVMYTIKVKGGVPVIAGETELNALIKSRAVERYEEFENAAKQLGIRLEETDESAEISDDVKEFKFDIAWKAGRRDYDYISIIVTATWQMDAANAVSGSESFTWNVKDKNLLSVNDILPFTGFDSLESLSAFAANKLREKLDPENADATLQKLIEHETAPAPENYSVFLLEKDGVTFYFNGAAMLTTGATSEPQVVKVFKRNS
jgi:hypothetical protein